MKKRLLTGICIFIMLGLCACQNAESEPIELPPAEEIAQAESEEETVQAEAVEENTEDVLEEQTEPVAAETEVIEEPEISEAVEEPASVFDALSVELTTYPILKYTIMGQERQLDYTQYEGMYMYDMVSEPSGAINYQTGDVTGDGLEELIVSIYVVGNNLSELMQDTYVYSIDADINDLNEILYIPASGIEQYAPGYMYNVGVCPTESGTLRLDVSTMKGDGGTPPSMSSVELVCQDGMWSVK